MDDLGKLRKALADIAAESGAFPIVEALADIWVEESQRTAPVDTGQLRATDQRHQHSGSGPVRLKRRCRPIRRMRGSLSTAPATSHRTRTFGVAAIRRSGRLVGSVSGWSPNYDVHSRPVAVWNPRSLF